MEEKLVTREFMAAGQSGVVGLVHSFLLFIWFRLFTFTFFLTYFYLFLKIFDLISKKSLCITSYGGDVEGTRPIHRLKMKELKCNTAAEQALHVILWDADGNEFEVLQS